MDRKLSVFSPDSERMPPVNAEAEVGVIAAMLLESSTILDIEPVLDARDFYREDLARAYTAILAVRNAGVEVEPIAVSEEMGRRGSDVHEHYMALVELCLAAPTHWHAKYYAGIVKQKSLTRGLIDLGNDLLHDAYSNQYTAEELIERAERSLFARSMAADQHQAEGIDRAMAEVVARTDPSAPPLSGLTTGIKSVDQTVGYILAEELIILAARPSIGKSALALSMMAHIAGETGRPVLFVSLEMSRKELAARYLSQVADVNGRSIVNRGKLSEYDRQRLHGALARSRGTTLLVDDSPTQSITSIASQARRLRAGDPPLAAVCVDYLQLVTPADQRAPRHEQVARMSREFKKLTKELGVPVFVLAQLNRESESGRGGISKPGERKDHTPRLHHLRESGAIEQDANQVWLLHRPEFYDEHDRPGEADLIIAKSRNGITGTVPLAFKKDRTLFTALTAVSPIRHEPIDDDNIAF